MTLDGDRESFVTSFASGITTFEKWFGKSCQPSCGITSVADDGLIESARNVDNRKNNPRQIASLDRKRGRNMEALNDLLKTYPSCPTR